MAHWSITIVGYLMGQVGVFDPAAVTGVCVLLALSGLLAGLVRAVRASRVQPTRIARRAGRWTRKHWWIWHLQGRWTHDDLVQ